MLPVSEKTLGIIINVSQKQDKKVFVSGATWTRIRNKSNAILESLIKFDTKVAA